MALPDKEITAAWKNTEDACKYMKVPPDTWTAVAVELGEDDLNELEIFSQIPAHEFEQVVINVAAGNIIKKTRLAALFNAVQIKFELPVVTFFKPKAPALSTTPQAR